jgi:hypothetical protein
VLFAKGAVLEVAMLPILKDEPVFSPSRNLTLDAFIAALDLSASSLSLSFIIERLRLPVRVSSVPRIATDRELLKLYLLLKGYPLGFSTIRAEFLK